MKHLIEVDDESDIEDGKWGIENVTWLVQIRWKIEYSR